MKVTIHWDDGPDDYESIEQAEETLAACAADKLDDRLAGSGIVDEHGREWGYVLLVTLRPCDTVDQLPESAKKAVREISKEVVYTSEALRTMFKQGAQALQSIWDILEPFEFKTRTTCKFCEKYIVEGVFHRDTGSYYCDRECAESDKDLEKFWKPDHITEDRMDEARESLADHPPGKPE